MSNELMIHENKSIDLLAEVRNTQKMCQELMKTPYYAKLTEVGIFAILQKARSMGIPPLEALEGMYFVKGKCEMYGAMMLAVIRSKGHSITMDPKSTDTEVVMVGKRADNGDTWRVKFSIEDAKAQGIYQNQWLKMPKVMCMWRCVSQLGRFLFSDILKGVYVQGEISESQGFDKIEHSSMEVTYQVIEEEKKVPDDQIVELAEILSECSIDYQEKVQEFLKKQGFDKLNQLPYQTFIALREKAINKKIENQPVKEDMFEQEAS